MKNLVIPSSYLDRDCPICGSIKKTLTGTRKMNMATTKGLYVMQHHDVQCDDCNFHYSTNIPDVAFINDYYKYNTIKHGAVGESVAEIRLSLIERLVPKALSILEYGAAGGQFVEFLRKAGYIAEGVDVNDDIPKGVYDAVCSYYTFEHLIYPNDVLKMLRELLGGKGVFVVEVPDYENYPEESFYSQHLNHFTEKYLRRMLVNNGFENIKVVDNPSRGFGFVMHAESVGVI